MVRRLTKVAPKPTPPRPPDFEFYVTGPAISARAKNKLRLRAWIAHVVAAAKPRGLLTEPRWLATWTFSSASLVRLQRRTGITWQNPCSTRCKESFTEMIGK
jgi:hypothetical protein